MSGKPVMPFQWGKQTLAEQLTQMAPTIAAGLVVPHPTEGVPNIDVIATEAVDIAKAIIERIYGPQVWS